HIHRKRVRVRLREQFDEFREFHFRASEISADSPPGVLYILWFITLIPGKGSPCPTGGRCSRVWSPSVSRGGSPRPARPSPKRTFTNRPRTRRATSAIAHRPRSPSTAT